MPRTLDREGLRQLLARPNLHDIVDAADAVRAELHGRRTTFCATAHLDCGRAVPWCPVTGEEAPGEGFAKSLEQLADASTDLVLLLSAEPSLADLDAAWSQLPPRPAGEADSPVVATVHPGTSSQWIAAIDAAAAEDDAVLAEWAQRGLHVLSDGVWPTMHPALGSASAERWGRFWRAAGKTGVRGQASVLYGPHHGLDDVFAQIDAIAALQDACGVFLSVAPCIYDPAGFGGAADALSTHASLDLRVFAACRIGLPQVEHVTLLYERSDLKSAHTALLCGVDDLCGHLFLGERDRKADAESDDLSLDEMVSWLAEAGFEPHLRNGLFEVETLRDDPSSGA